MASLSIFELQEISDEGDPRSERVLDGVEVAHWLLASTKGREALEKLGIDIAGVAYGREKGVQPTVQEILSRLPCPPREIVESFISNLGSTPPKIILENKCTAWEKFGQTFNWPEGNGLPLDFSNYIIKINQPVWCSSLATIELFWCSSDCP